MKTIIAGSRTAGMNETNAAAQSCPWVNQISAVICGMAKGADLCGNQWAEYNSIPVIAMPADWSTGKGAGFDRNLDMLEIADCLIAVWDGKSRGTANMIAIAQARKIPVHIHIF